MIKVPVKYVYKRLIKIYIAIVLATIIIVSLLTYTIFRQSMKNDMSAYISNSLVLASSSNNSIMNEISIIQNSVLSNPKAIHLLFGNEPNYLYEYDVYRELHRMITYDAYISSVMIYNGKIKRLVYELPSNVAKTDLYQHISSRANTPSMKVFPWVQRTTTNAINMISFTIDTGLNLRSEYNGTIIVSIAEDVLKKRLSSLSFNNQSILVINDRGLVISSAGGYNFLDDLSNLQWVRDISLSSERSGGFIIRDNRQKLMVSYVKANYFGWIYISMLPISVLGTQTLALKNTLIALAVLIFLFLLGAIFVRRKLLKPMARLYRFIGNYGSDDDTNEFELLENTFSHQIHTINQLENTIGEYKPVLHQAFLLSLLEGFSNQPATSKSLPHNVEDALISPYYAVMIFRPYLSSITDNYQMLAFDDLCTTIKIKLPCEIIKQPGTDLTILCRSTLSLNCDHILQNIEAIQNHAQSIHDLHVSVAIGNTVEKIEYVYLSYQTARENLRYSFFYGPGSILTSKTIEVNQKGFVAFPFSLECSIKQDIKSGDQASLSNHLHEFKSIISGAAIDNAIAFLRQLYYGVVEDLASKSLVNIPVFYDLKSLMPDTLDEAILLLEERFTEGCQIARSIENEPNNFLVTRIKAYVNKNFNDPNLSLTSLSEEFSVSTGHISRWFKHFNRIGFVEYLSSIRLEESCKLLNDSDLSMAAICRRVGISNINYYFTIFKKRYGITPSQYREYCRNTKTDEPNQS